MSRALQWVTWWGEGPPGGWKEGARKGIKPTGLSSLRLDLNLRNTKLAAARRKMLRMRLWPARSSARAHALLAPPSIPGARGACDVRWFNPETAVTAEATEQRGCRWWALQGSG